MGVIELAPTLLKIKVMKSKQYFQLDKVHSVTLTYEQVSDYKWVPEIPAQPKFNFFGIQYGMTEPIPAGWSDYEHGRFPKPTSYFDQYSWYRVDEVNKQIYTKAHVEIRFGYKESIGVRFDTNKEADDYVNSLVEASGKEFSIIINK